MKMSMDYLTTFRWLPDDCITTAITNLQYEADAVYRGVSQCIWQPFSNSD
jgi:hypothetical protein